MHITLFQYSLLFFKKIVKKISYCSKTCNSRIRYFGYIAPIQYKAMLKRLLWQHPVVGFSNYRATCDVLFFNFCYGGKQCHYFIKLVLSYSIRARVAELHPRCRPVFSIQNTIFTSRERYHFTHLLQNWLHITVPTCTPTTTT